MEKEKSAEAMWEQKYEIQKYDLVNWRLKYWPQMRNKHCWKHSCFPFNFEIFLRGEGVGIFPKKNSLIRDLGVSKTIATSKMKLFVALVCSAIN